MDSDIKNYVFKKGLRHELEVIAVRQLFNTHNDELTTSHRTGFYHVIWFKAGNPTHLIDFNPIEIKPNSILFISKDSVQRFDNRGNFDGKAILFTDSFFCTSERDTKFLRSTVLFNDPFSVSQIQLDGAANKKFTILFEQLEDELKNNNDSNQSEILRNLLHNFLLFSERERRKQNSIVIKGSAALDCVIFFKEVLGKKFISVKKVSHYAEELNITEKQLNNATSKILGKTAKQMIDDRIMLEAKRLLVHTNKSIKKIGFTLGFEEPTNFIKYFKKHHRTTPMEFRENITF